MFKRLDEIRCVEKSAIIGNKVLVTVGLLMLGVLLGVLSKYLDYTPSNELPYVIEFLDIRNFLGRFAVWVVIALSISVYSFSPVKAGINVFAFFLGMVSSYYLYSKFVAGFFPKTYALIWFGITLISPLMAYVCWYAKGKGKISLVLSSMILAVLFNMTFVYGWGYFEWYSLLEALVFVCGILIMKRTSIKETIIMIIGSICVAVIMNLIFPFHFG